MLQGCVCVLQEGGGLLKETLVARLQAWTLCTIWDADPDMGVPAVDLDRAVPSVDADRAVDRTVLAAQLARSIPPEELDSSGAVPERQNRPEPEQPNRPDRPSRKVVKGTSASATPARKPWNFKSPCRLRLMCNVPKGRRVDGFYRSDIDGRAIVQPSEPRPWANISTPVASITANIVTPACVATLL